MLANSIMIHPRHHVPIAETKNDDDDIHHDKACFPSIVASDDNLDGDDDDGLANEC